MLHTDLSRKPQRRMDVKWQLVIYDTLLILAVSGVFIGLKPSMEFGLPPITVLEHMALAMACIIGTRLVCRVYHQIWRYARINCYLGLIVCDFIAGAILFVLQKVLPLPNITFMRVVGIVSVNLLLSIAMRLLYQYLYESGSTGILALPPLRRLASMLTGLDLNQEIRKFRDEERKIGVAIVGAGRVGAMLAEELRSNPSSIHVPKCFVDVDQSKVGRYVYGIQVLSQEEATPERLAELLVQEIVFALPEAEPEKKKELYERYKKTGCRLKVYDYPVAQTMSGSGEKARRMVRSFGAEELLFRETRDFTSPRTRSYYGGKTVLISGGGGSIGSEIARQISQMQPKTLVILDVYENCAYDIQQELKIACGKALDLHVEILSICDRNQLEGVFRRYRPNVVLHAAAHKHVPLMEHNCCEAVKNNVFGTLNMVELAEAYGVEKFIMISTDKAVNPTNVMGATKRMCEMIVLSHQGKTSCSATRFGNVLGSNGSVIPLFRRQIEAGGPVTLTDRRIIRYFMTIPEACQLVLTSGAMAKNGELYVLDMGKPVKILDLAENMIRLSGFEPYKDIDIVETGLRPGEKLYEELLIHTEELDKTENSMIFVEKDRPQTPEAIREKLEILRAAVSTEDNDAVREALRRAVPTYHTPEEVNAEASRAKEMHNVRELAGVR